MQKIIVKTLLIISAMLLVACSGVTVTREETPVQKRQRESQSLLTGQAGRGINLNQALGGSQSGAALPVNALLWRASIDTLSVVPLNSIDTYSGTIISDWYKNPENPNQRIKIALFVLDQELRSDAIKAEVYVQHRTSASNDWTDAGRDTELAIRLEELVLTRAREIRAGGLIESN